MLNTRQTILASRPAAMVLALILVAALTVPALMLPHAQAADDPPLPCAEANYNGCTELSPTPPEDMVSVPPNMVLMLDDSGSMAWDYMPDWDFLAVQNQWGQRNINVNYVYYNPAKVYTPPPKADGTLYPDSPGLTNAYLDGFADTLTNRDVRTYQASPDADLNHEFPYGTSLPTTLFTTSTTDKGAAVWGGASAGGCPSGYSPDPSDSSQCIRAPVSPTEKWTCNSGDTYYASHGGLNNQCQHTEFTEHGRVTTWYDATDAGPQCPGGSTYDSSDSLCHYAPKPVIPPTPDHWICPNGGSTNASAPPPPNPAPECIATSNNRIWVWAFMYTVGTDADPTLSDAAHTHFVVPAPDPNDPNAPSDGWCNHLYPGTSPYMWNGFHMDTAHCVAADDPNGTAAPRTYTDADGNTQTYTAQDGTPLTPGQNIANWFSYYRTRLLMSKSGLMKAFNDLKPTVRFGFASINGNGKNNIPDDPTYVVFNDASGFAGDQYNRLAVVQPFGLGSDPNSQRTKFWNWIAHESASNGTPLRLALQAVGEYYKTDQPWTTMPGDPGYTADSNMKFACRASYTILTTDGFWNGGNPTVAGIAGAADRDGPVQTVPSGDMTHYVAQPPFKGGSADGGSLADVATYYWENDLKTGLDWPNEVAPNSTDQASWQHMTTFTVGLGFDPEYIQPFVPTATSSDIGQIFGWANFVDDPAHATDPNPTSSDFAWPGPVSNDVRNIADLAHAAVNGHGEFFNIKSSQDLANSLNKVFNDINSHNSETPAASVNASVLSLGALSFNTSYHTSDWSGSLEGVTLKADGTIDTTLWSAGGKLDSAYHSTDATDYGSRKVYTDSYKDSTFSPLQFNATNAASLDTTETAGLESPAFAGSYDTLEHRIDYLLGDSTYESLTPLEYRTRTTILGAIIRSEPVYIKGATGNYYDNWPDQPGPPETSAPESSDSAQKFGAFVTQQSTKPGVLYVGANDGMLHAFLAPVPTCSTYDSSTGACSLYATESDAGTELWAFIPRAVYGNLGNLTLADGFQYRPTVDASPVRRDVFFSENDRSGNSHAEWHTILAGGVGLGGRGVYALDVTDPDSFSNDDVLWEFDSDMTPSSDCVATYGSCQGTDLGYTVSQPNISRLHNGKWAVLVPNGYFPDCTTPDTPTNDVTKCQAIAAQAPKDSGKPYSALFVFDAQTGTMIAELKTPTDIDGVTSFGLATPVLGDYNNDQVDDVAFAGDVQGNLWRFDLSSPDPSDWTVTLVYKGLTVDGHQGVQPITSMPHLFPDPTTNRFMVLFGTGKFIGVGDNGNTTTQAIIAVRDKVGETYSQEDNDLVQQYLHETTITDADSPLNGVSVRCVTGSADDSTCDPPPANPHATPVNDVPASKGGWFVNLYTTTSDGTQNDAGERVVVTPGAIFASNTVVFETLITGDTSSDVCNPQTQGSILALNALTGVPAGVSSLGGGQIAGARINNARTSGSLPVVSSLGGGKAYLPGTTLAPAGTTPMSIDAPIWRRRSWQEIN